MADKTQANDDKIKALLTAVETKRANLGTRPKGERQTNGLFKYRSDKTFNIHTIKNTDAFLDALAFLYEGKLLREKAAEQLGIEVPDFKWNGYTIEQWTADFKLRIAVLQYEKKKKQLAAAEKVLNDRMSEGSRTELELEDLEKLLA